MQPVSRHRLIRFCLALLAIALCASHATAQTSLSVPDPGFETPALSGSGPYQYDPPGAPWAFGGGSGLVGNGSAFGNPAAPEMFQAAFLQGAGAISQPLTGFQAGGQYTLTVAAAQRDYNGAGGVSRQTVQVTLDGAALGTITPTGTAYQDYSLTFTTSAGGHTLTLQGAPADGNDDTAFLDDVRFSYTSAPAAPASFNGYLDSADAGSIGGWAWDASQPNVPIAVDIYDGVNKLTTVSAGNFRQDLLSAGIGNGFHGYSLPTPASLLDGQPHTVHVYYAGTATELQSSPRTVQLVSAPASFDGFLDSADAGSITGWAWDANQPNAPVSVDVYDGATKLTTLVADGFRQDLADAGKGNGAHGYDFPTPASLLDGQPHTVHVRYAGTATDLQFSPRTVQGTPAALSGLSLSPSAVTGGASAAGTVTLSGPAPAGGLTVSLSSDNAAATVPAGVTVAAGSTGAAFTVTTGAVPAATAAHIAASYGGVTKTATLTVNPSASSVPSLSLVTAVNNQASLTWTAVNGAASYNLYRSTTSGTGYTKVVSGTTATSYMDQGCTNGTSYYYVVTAVDASSVESAYSNEVTANPSAQAFGFLNVGNGSTLSGDMSIDVSMASNTYGDEGNQISLQVDGQDYSAGGDNQTAVSGNSGADTTFDLDTEAFSNGPHTLTVVDVNGNEASVQVTFANVFSSVNIPSMFDTTGGDGLPTALPISANLGTAQPWTVQIVTYDDASTVLKTFTGNSSTINLTWDGTDDSGDAVADDVYEVVLNTTATSASSTSFAAASAATSNTTRKIVNKNTPGDCFIMIDPAVYPNKAAIKPYLQAIKNDLAPTKNSVWNKMSIFVLSHPFLTTAEAARINTHFSNPLTVFYVECHGGIYNGPEFGLGGHFWHASFNGPYPYGSRDHNMQALTASANYSSTFGNYPPALVFIDSCKSAGGQRGNVFSSGNDTTFANDFDIPDLFGAFMGWNGDSVEYGAYAPPNDDWTFWRLDLWAQFTNPNQTYATDWAHLNRDYNNKGFGFQSGARPSDRMISVYFSNANF